MLWAAESGSLRFGTDRAKAERLINNELQANWLLACAELSAQGLDALAQAQVRGIVPSAAGVLCHTGDLQPLRHSEHEMHIRLCQYSRNVNPPKIFLVFLDSGSSLLLPAPRPFKQTCCFVILSRVFVAVKQHPAAQHSSKLAVQSFSVVKMQSCSDHHRLIILHRAWTASGLTANFVCVQNSSTPDTSKLGPALQSVRCRH